jgi:hypothetical protein
MNTARTVGTSVVVAALALSLVGCNQASGEAKTVTTVEKARFVNTQVCNTPAWIRDRAPAGACTSTPVVDDDMSLRRLHEEREHSGR